MIPKRVVHATALSPREINFAFVSSFFWTKHFEVKPDLALVVKASEIPSLNRVLELLNPHCNVHVLEANPVLDIESQVELARWFLAAKIDSLFTIISPLNAIPLNPSHFLTEFADQKPDTLHSLRAKTLYGQMRAKTLYGQMRASCPEDLKFIIGARRSFAAYLSLDENMDDFSMFVERMVATVASHRAGTSRRDGRKLLARNLFRRRSEVEGTNNKLATNHLTRQELKENFRCGNGIISHPIPSENPPLALLLPAPFLENRRKIMKILEGLDPGLIFRQLPLPYSLGEWKIRRILSRLAVTTGRRA